MKIAATSLQSCPTVWPHRRQPTRLPHPWDSPGKNTGVGCHFLLQCMKMKSESEVAQLCLTLATPWTAAYQAPPSMGFFQARVLEWGAIAFSDDSVYGVTKSWTWLSHWTTTAILLMEEMFKWWTYGLEILHCGSFLCIVGCFTASLTSA